MLWTACPRGNWEKVKAKVDDSDCFVLLQQREQGGLRFDLRGSEAPRVFLTRTRRATFWRVPEELDCHASEHTSPSHPMRITHSHKSHQCPNKTSNNSEPFDSVLPEIITLIGHFILDRHSLLASVLVCRVWHTSLIPCLWSDLLLQPPVSQLTSNQLLHLLLPPFPSSTTSSPTRNTLRPCYFPSLTRKIRKIRLFSSFSSSSTSIPAPSIPAPSIPAPSIPHPSSYYPSFICKIQFFGEIDPQLGNQLFCPNLTHLTFNDSEERGSYRMHDFIHRHRFTLVSIRYNQRTNPDILKALAECHQLKDLALDSLDLKQRPDEWIGIFENICAKLETLSFVGHLFNNEGGDECAVITVPSTKGRVRAKIQDLTIGDRYPYERIMQAHWWIIRQCPDLVRLRWYFFGCPPDQAPMRLLANLILPARNTLRPLLHIHIQRHQPHQQQETTRNWTSALFCS